LHLRSAEVAEKQNGQNRIAVDVPYHYSFLSSRDLFTCADTTSDSEVLRWPREGNICAPNAVESLQSTVSVNEVVATIAEELVSDPEI
jgi:hypothetical protein